MTPARFDILYLIHENYLEIVRKVCGYEMAQASVTRALGLSRQTVWKMVERLVELGLITKTKNPHCHPQRNILKLTDDGIRRVRQAMCAAFTETTPLPKDAPGENPPRYWRRPELAPSPTDAAGNALPAKRVGREVGRVYSSFIWERVGGGRRGKRHRHLDLLDRMVEFGREIAQALGNTSTAIYSLGYEPDH